nr:phage antirepressor KilAC domain-containing protein [Microbacterium bovistercoris]
MAAENRARVTAVMLPPRLLIARVHRHDIKVLVDFPYVYLSKADVDGMCGIPAWSTGEQLLLPDDEPVGLPAGEFYTVDVAVHRASEDATDQVEAARFLNWVDEELPALTAPDVLEAAAHSPSFRRSWPVGNAARILSVNLGTRLTRQWLFRQLEQAGWVARPEESADWGITPAARVAGWLTTRSVTVRAGRSGRVYEQVHVTRPGLVELHRILGGITDPIIPDPTDAREDS